MKLQQRDRRALFLLVGAAVLFGILFFATGGEERRAAATGRLNSIPAAERRLARLREQAATVSGKEKLLKQVTADLDRREKGIIQAQTAAQAQAQLLDVVRRVAKEQNPPLEFGNVELSQEVKKLGEYGEVEVTVPLTCRIEELVNFLADMAKQQAAVATSEVRINSKDDKQKTIAARVTVSGLVPKRLVPEKKGVAAF